MEKLGGRRTSGGKTCGLPSPPYLNPLYHSIWSVLQERVQGVLHPNMESLKVHIAEARDILDEAFIASACRSFRSRVEAVISANCSNI